MMLSLLLAPVSLVAGRIPGTKMGHGGVSLTSCNSDSSIRWKGYGFKRYGAFHSNTPVTLSIWC